MNNLTKTRQFKINNVIKANESLKFNNIIEFEFKVKNKDDNFDISATCYKPQNYLRPDSSITIFIHGGGWTFYNVLSYSNIVKSLVNRTNTIWVSVEYRLCPEFKFPIGLNDCKHVLEYIYNNKDKFSSDKAKIGVSGDSSGGHYAALLSNQFHSIIDYQILIYPCVHVGKKYELDENSTEMEYLLKNLFDFTVLNDLKMLDNESISPIEKKCFKDMPITLLIAAELDSLVYHAEKYHEKLKKFGVYSELRIIKGVSHGFFNLPVLMKEAFEECQKHISNFLSID